jgi:hypothetical protein
VDTSADTAEGTADEEESPAKIDQNTPEAFNAEGVSASSSAITQEHPNRGCVDASDSPLGPSRDLAPPPHRPERASPVVGVSRPIIRKQDGERDEQLGKKTKKPSSQEGSSSLEGETHAQKRRNSRYALRDVLREITQLPRVAGCGRRRITATQEPEVRLRTDQNRRVAHFARVQLCGRVWVCPVCGPRIRQTRAQDLDMACARWLDRHGTGSVMLLTLTVPHDYGESLKRVVDRVRSAFGALSASC